jgi:hypothetical protein
LILQNHLLKSDSELFQNILTVHNLQPWDSISRWEWSEQTTKIATVENSNRIKAQALHHFLKKEYTDDTQRSIVIRQLLEFGACGTAEYDNRCVRALPSFKESLSNKWWVIFENATHTVYTKVDQTYSSSLW